MSKPRSSQDNPILKHPDNGKLSIDERRQAQKKWFDQTLIKLMEVAVWEPGFAKLLIQSVIDKFGGDDNYSLLITKSLKMARAGKSRGKKAEWGYGRYQRLLQHYHFQKAWIGRTKALEMLAKIEGLRGDNKAKKLAAHITKARKVVKPADQAEINGWPIPPLRT